MLMLIVRLLMSLCSGSTRARAHSCAGLCRTVPYLDPERRDSLRYVVSETKRPGNKAEWQGPAKKDSTLVGTLPPIYHGSLPQSAPGCQPMRVTPDPSHG